MSEKSNLTIDLNKVKQLLESYWKKWEPYEHIITRNYINLAIEDFLYRIELYNDLIKRNDLSHFYPLRTIFERLVKYETLLTFSQKKRESWLHWDMSEKWKELSKEAIDFDDAKNGEINVTLNNLEKICEIDAGKRKLDVRGTLDKSKIVNAKDTYDIYQILSEYDHGSLLSVAMRKHGNNIDTTKEFSKVILKFLEKLGST